MTPISFGRCHCCVCSGVCHHIGPPSFCARHGGTYVAPVTPPVSQPFIVITPTTPTVAPWRDVDGFMSAGVTSQGFNIYACVRCGAAVCFPALHDEHEHNDQPGEAADGSHIDRPEAP